jgi:aminocarboxymuconate-semialdehyde decarboxylase
MSMALKPLVIKSKKGKSLAIDLHCHVLTPQTDKLVEGLPGKRAEGEANRATQGPASAQYNAKVQGPNIAQQLSDIDRRLADMDKMGVDLQVISPAPGQFYYWADMEVAREHVQMTNENLASYCARHPDRFAALGNIALQHPEIALEQLDYAIHTLGFRGFEICTSPLGKDLDDPLFAPFWAKVEEEGALVFLHPQSCPPLTERLNKSYLSNIIGNPLDTTIALSHLIFGGVLDRHPGLKILGAHGGGFLASYCTRSDHCYHARTDAHSMAKAPTEYFKQLFFDTIVYTPEALKVIIDNVGASQVMVGTDYPYDMGHYDPHGLVNAVKGLSDSDKRAILSENALRALNIRVE